MPRLVTVPFSHFCEKARWALDLSEVAYTEEGHVPALHRRAVRPLSGKTTVPVLVLDDGQVLAESSLIVRYADAHAPVARKFLPPDGAARDEALAFERSLDIDFAVHVRRFAYFHVLPDRATAFRYFDRETPRGEQRILRLLFPIVRVAMQRFMHITDATALASRDAMRRGFDDVGTRLADGRPFLMGDTFGLADLAFASLAAPVLWPDEHPFVSPPFDTIPGPLAAEITAMRQTPGGQFALRVYKTHRGPCRRGAPAS